MNRMVLVLVLAFGCSDRPESESIDKAATIDPSIEAQKPWEQEPEALLAQCERQPTEALKTTCWVQAAAVLGRTGQAERATDICKKITAPTWKYECHFRAGEELGKAGKAIPALKHCAAAGHFGRYCLTHTAWNLPRNPAITPAVSPEQIAQLNADFMNEIDAALMGAGDGLEGEGHDLLMARFGYNLYVGSGQTNPGPSKLPGELGVVLRTGFAIECARLLAPAEHNTSERSRKHRKSSATVEEILEIWNEQQPPLQGDGLSESQRMGRYITPMFTQIEEQEVSDWTPLFGGGVRLVGETPEEDLIIAGLEALFWLPHTSAESFLPWINDHRQRVRWTAARLARLTPAEDGQLKEKLKQVVATHSDPNVRAHAQDGITHQTWIRKPRKKQNAPD